MRTQVNNDPNTPIGGAVGNFRHLIVNIPFCIKRPPDPILCPAWHWSSYIDSNKPLWWCLQQINLHMYIYIYKGWINDHNFNMTVTITTTTTLQPSSHTYTGILSLISINKCRYTYPPPQPHSRYGYENSSVNRLQRMVHSSSKQAGDHPRT